MLYLFACVSPQCIKRSDCVKAFRGVAHDRNPHVTFVSDEDYNFVIERSDATLKTSRLADMYTMQNNEQDAAEDDDRFADADEDEESKTEQQQAANMYGALSFKPKLKEYLINTGEEAEADTLFYLRHARRLAEDNVTQNEKMEEELDHAFVALGFSNANKGADSAIGDKQADKMLKAY